MNPKIIYKYLVITYESEYSKEHLCFQGIFDTDKRANMYAEVLKKSGEYSHVKVESVPYLEGV